MGQAVFKVVIPARYASVRFPGKVLADIRGKPMLRHVYENACASGAEEVVIATEDKRVARVAQAFDAKCCMTSAQHASGSDRIAEVITRLGWPDDTVIVNVQGDEPFMPPVNITQVAANLIDRQLEMASLRTPIVDSNDINNPNVVKVVVDCNDMALYFSRAVIPHQRDASSGVSAYNRHIGLYAYRAGFLQHYTRTPMAVLEETEKLEQLRALWMGVKIHVACAHTVPGPGIDTPEELAQLEIQ